MSLGSTITKYALVAFLFISLGYWLSPYFAGNSHIPSIAFYIGEWEIRWYGVTMALGILASGLYSLYVVLPKMKSVTENQLLDAMIWMILGGVIGARLLFVALKWSEYANQLPSIWHIWEGGLSLHGAILGGMIALILYTRSQYSGWTRISLKISDVVAVGLPLGQAIGRLGNFFNQEAFGGPTSLPWKMYIEPSLRPSDLSGYNFFHPTFAYEVVLNILLFSVLTFLVSKYKFSGQLFLVYTGAYSLIRFFIEYFRVDSDHLGQLSIAQWGSLVIFVASIWAYWYLNRRHSFRVSVQK